MLFSTLSILYPLKFDSVTHLHFPKYHVELLWLPTTFARLSVSRPSISLQPLEEAKTAPTPLLEV